MFDLIFMFKLLRGGLDCSGLLEQLQFNIPYKLPRQVKYVPFKIKGSRSNLGHYSIMNRLQRQYNKLQKKTDVDIFSNGLYRFKKIILDTLKSK
jgi:hypothetical protein